MHRSIMPNLSWQIEPRQDAMCHPLCAAAQLGSPPEGLPGALVLQLRLSIFDSASPGPQVILSHWRCQCEARSVHPWHLFLLFYALHLCLEQGVALQADQLN